MSKYIYLSYFLNKSTPLYGGSVGIEIIKDRDISAGDSANTKFLKLHNHSGTHIDFPNHFILNGKKSSDYKADFWIFKNPYVLNIPCEENDIIKLNDSQLKNIPRDTDFLILNTGFHKFRQKKIYWNNNPGVDPSVANQLKKQCPNIKILGMDFISLTSFQNREIGRVSHKEFLGKNNILLVEDMDLNLLDYQPEEIMCLPLMVENIDGCPVTIIAR